MTCSLRRRAALLASVALLAISLPAGVDHAGPFSIRSAAAAEGSVSLDDISVQAGEKTTYKFKRIDLTGANLSRDEATKLFSGAASPDETAALLAKLEARRISIPEVVVAKAGGGSTTFRDFVAEGVSGGKVARATLSGFDGVIPMENGAGDATLKGFALTIDGLDLQRLFAALKAGKNIEDGGAKLARLAWNGFELTFPDKDTPASAPGGNLIKIKLASMSGDQTYDGDVPLKGSGAINGLVVELPKASEVGAALAAQGYDKIETSLRFNGAYDPARRAYSLDDFTIDAAQVGSIGLRGQFSSVDKTAFLGGKEERLSALLKADVGSLDIRVVNGGAFEKVVAYFAQSEKKTPEAIKAGWAAFVGQAGPVLLPGEPAAAKVGDALAKFIAYPKSLTIAAKGKAGPVKISDLAAIDNPSAALAKIDVDAFAEANPNGAATQTRAAPAPKTGGAAVAAPVPTEAAKLSGLAAWNALVGNTIVGKDSEGGELVEFYLPDGKVKQLSEDEVTGGKWAAKGAKVCFLYSGEKTETCYRVEVFGDVATFTDDEGDGRRYRIVKGNPKGL